MSRHVGGGIELEGVVPFGRSLLEYRRMFNLSDEDLTRRIIGVGDGPASFNAEMHSHGGHVVSVDPIYQVSRELIKRRIDETTEEVVRKVKEKLDGYHWDGAFCSPEELGAYRLATMGVFLEDFETGKEEGRYVVGELPRLDFPDGSFDIALCSHLLFTYTEHLGEKLHVQGVMEMLRVADEVRIYPLQTVDTRPSRLLPVVKEALAAAGFLFEEQAVATRVQKGSYSMLRAWRE